MQSSYYNFYLSLLIFIVLVFLGPIALIEADISRFSNSLLLFYLIIVYSAFRLVTIGLSINRRLIEMTFYIFTYVFMGLVPYGQIVSHSFYWPGSYTDNNFFLAGLTIIVGLISFEIGLKMGNKINPIEVRPLKLTLGSIQIMIIISLLLFVVGFVAIGGASVVFGTRGEVSGALGSISGSAIGTAILRVPVFVTLIFCLVYFINKENRHPLIKSNLFTIVSIFVLLVVNMIASNPLSTPRFWLGSIFFAIFFIISSKHKQHTVSHFIIITLGILLLVFPYSDVFRYDNEFKVNIQGFHEKVIISGDFDAFQQLMNIQKHTDINGFSYGEQIISSALFWVPRSIWDGKSQGTGMLAAESVMYDYTNLSAPIFGEFFIDFGFIGLIPLFICYGYLTARMQNLYIYCVLNKQITVASVIVPIFAAYQIFLLRGQLMSTLPFLFVIAIFSIVGVKLTTSKKNRIVWSK
ncbi:oligosaccharide repeat unit polymerase [Bacillus tianshenii]|uniref:Oligosaccharide repeat unit polymerase n=1 Tax=Sutcliffiella tianshenii TaxID=1463404 RepID=A0ABS2NVR5_9BACI|nr:oligosaccharide repeat unit polymerase [Bacillus tianshenii]MBM7618572.1 oligosaccharide repeat unit polymerase [Bacillus tianshenii]